MSYTYDNSGNNFTFILPTISGVIITSVSGLTSYVPKTSTLSGVITYTGVGGNGSYVQTISGLFSGFSNYNNYFNSLTISSYVNKFSFLTVSGYVSPFASLKSIASVITISGSTYITGSGIDPYARQLAYSISGSVYSNYYSQGNLINNSTNTINYLYFYDLSLSGQISSVNNSHGSYINNLAFYNLSLSGVVYGNYNNLGGQINTINNNITTLQGGYGVDGYARLLASSLSGNVYSNYYSTLGNSINNINTINSGLSGRIYNNLFSQGALINTLQGGSGIDQYSRTYSYSISSVVYSNYFIQGSLINSSTSSINTNTSSINNLNTITTGMTYSSGTTTFSSHVSSNNYCITSGAGGGGTHNGMFSGRGASLDGADYTNYDLEIRSFYGIGFRDTANNATNIILDCRSGDTTMTGTLKAYNINTTNINIHNNIYLSSIDYNCNTQGTNSEGMSLGTADGTPSSSVFNLALRTWWGMALINTSSDGNTGSNRVKHYWNARNGHYNATGIITCGNCTVGNNLKVGGLSVESSHIYAVGSPTAKIVTMNKVWFTGPYTFTFSLPDLSPYGAGYSTTIIIRHSENSATSVSVTCSASSYQMYNNTKGAASTTGLNIGDMISHVEMHGYYNGTITRWYHGYTI